MTEDAGFTEAAPAEPAVTEPGDLAPAGDAGTPEPAEAVSGPPVPDGPPQPAAEPEDHVPPPWLPPGQPEWFTDMVYGFHRRLRDLERA